MTHRLLGVPWSAVDLSGATCGFSNTATATLSDTEQPVDQRRTQLGNPLRSSVASGMLGGAVAAGVVTSWGSGVALQRSVAALSVASCVGEAALEEPPDAGSSPLQLALGSGIGQYARGAVVGNVVLCCCAVLVGCGVACLVYVRKKKATAATRQQQKALQRWTVRRAVAATGMPVGVFPVLGALLPPTAGSAVSLLWTGADVGLGVFGLAVCAGAVAAVCALVCVRGDAFGARPVRLRRRRRSRGTWLQRLSAALTGRTWRWADRRRGFVGTYGGVFEGSSGGRHWWAAVELAVAVGSGAVGGVLPSDTASCTAVASVLAVAAASLAVLLVALRPYDTLLDTAQGVAANAMTVVAVVVGLSSDSESAATGLVFAQAVQLLASLGLWLLLTITVEDVGSTSLLRRLVALLREGDDSSSNNSESSSSSSSDTDSSLSSPSSSPVPLPVTPRPQVLPVDKRQKNLERLIQLICTTQAVGNEVSNRSSTLEHHHSD